MGLQKQLFRPVHERKKFFQNDCEVEQKFQDIGPRNFI